MLNVLILLVVVASVVMLGKYLFDMLFMQMKKDMKEELLSLTVNEWIWVQEQFPEYQKQIEIVVNNGYNANNLVSFRDMQIWKKIFQSVYKNTEKHYLLLT